MGKLNTPNRVNRMVSQAVNEELPSYLVLDGLSTGVLVLTHQSIAPYYPGCSI